MNNATPKNENFSKKSVLSCKFLSIFVAIFCSHIYGISVSNMETRKYFFLEMETETAQFWEILGNAMVVDAFVKVQLNEGMGAGSRKAEESEVEPWRQEGAEDVVRLDRGMGVYIEAEKRPITPLSTRRNKKRTLRQHWVCGACILTVVYRKIRGFIKSG